MGKRTIIIVVLLYLLTIFQVSFLGHFKFFSADWLRFINLTLLFCFVLAIFERRSNDLAWPAAAWGGFFLDLYSDFFFGFWMLVLLALTLIIKLFLKRYVRIPSFW